MLLVILSALMVTLASAQFPFAPQYPVYPGNYYQQHQYQDNRAIQILPNAFIKTTTVNSTLTVSVTCTVSTTACVRRRSIDNIAEQFAPSEVVP
jgi:hypothetical protein